jgi:DNA-binding NtrC family response regulator
LLISPEEADHLILRSVFQRHGWTLEGALSLRSGSDMLNQKDISVIVTERDFPAGNWKDVLEISQSLTATTLVIIISRFADDYLWAEALNLGAYDVLLKPLDETEVVRVLTSAWSRLFPKPRKGTPVVRDASASEIG